MTKLSLCPPCPFLTEGLLRFVPFIFKQITLCLGTWWPRNCSKRSDRLSHVFVWGAEIVSSLNNSCTGADTEGVGTFYHTAIAGDRKKNAFEILNELARKKLLTLKIIKINFTPRTTLHILTSYIIKVVQCIPQK